MPNEYAETYGAQCVACTQRPVVAYLAHSGALLPLCAPCWEAERRATILRQEEG